MPLLIDRLGMLVDRLGLLSVVTLIRRKQKVGTVCPSYSHLGFRLLAVGSPSISRRYPCLERAGRFYCKGSFTAWY